MEKKKKTINFIYQKNNYYKNYHVDGVVGSLTPKGLINLNFFVERNPIPTQITFEINKDNTLGKEIDRKSKIGVIREINTGIVIDLQTAKSIVEWLNAKIDEHKKIFDTKVTKK